VDLRAGRRALNPASRRITEIGFAVALGVLLDTIIVRSVLVTALTLDIGRWMWWPSKLARRVTRQADTAVSAPATPVRSYEAVRQGFADLVPGS